MLKLSSLSFAFALVIGTGAVAFFNQIIGVKALVTATLPLLGTFLGAMLAFRLNEKREAEQLHKTQKQTLNRALFVLMRQQHAMHQLVEFSEPYHGNLEQGFTMPATVSPKYDDLQLPLSALDRLFDTPNPSILVKLAVAQETFEQSLMGWNRRANFYFDEVLPKLAEHKLNRTLP
jgi:hypothetical protein